MEFLRDKRVILCLLVLAGISAVFWGTSRYPGLDEKATMGGDIELEDPLGFEALFPVDPDDRVSKKIALTTINWLHTNQQGMTFGLLLAAAMMSLFSLLRRTGFEGRLGNTLLGMAVGAPLGVCVNCAAPIARGMSASGARIETSLAAMISSPTLNIVILTMLFAIFPPFLALTKVAFTLLFIVVMIPLLSRFAFGASFGPADLTSIAAGTRSIDTGTDTDNNWAPVEAGASGWGESLVWMIRDYVRNLVFIVVKTVPLMLLAGAVGATVVTLLPWETIAKALPAADYWRTLQWSAGVAIVGLLLPVPIAFDVVVTAALLEAGLPASYAMVLLFTLGIFSIYSFMIVTTALSLRVACVLSVALIAFALAAGSLAHFYERFETRRAEQLIVDALPQLAPTEGRPPITVASLAGFRVRPPVWRRAPGATPSFPPLAIPWRDVDPGGAAGVSVARRPFGSPKGEGESLFTASIGRDLGLEAPNDLPVAYRFSSPFYSTRPIAAGDVHGDGWPDIVMGSPVGPMIFANRGGGSFEPQSIAGPSLAEFFVGLVALVDLDDDGWLDLFFTTYRNGAWAIPNRGGRFDANDLRSIPGGDANLVPAAGFGDVDRDGDLDAVLGRWSTGTWHKNPLVASKNRMLWNRGGSFEPEVLPGPAGETLSTLLSDVDGDGDLDLIVGNDFEIPDVYYLGDGAGALRQVARQDELVPHTAYSTMSIDSADIDNDLHSEIYIGQVTGRSGTRSERMLLTRTDTICDEYAGFGLRERCEGRVRTHTLLSKARNTRNPSNCLALGDPTERGSCIALHRLRWATLGREDGSRCPGFPAWWEAFEHICRTTFGPSIDYTKEDRTAQIKQVAGRNMLFVRNDAGRFDEAAEERGVDTTGWTWNARFADFDSDEWQDLYIVNGMWRSNKRESNVYLANRGDGHFDDRTVTSGLKNVMASVSAAYVDLDQDGDLDIVTVPLEGPIVVYRNNTRERNNLIVELRDHRGNHFGIGSRIFVHYGPDASRHQMREIKSSGGFTSFDPPEAHFGLGSHAEVDRIEIQWSTGAATELAGPFRANHRYRVTRAD